MAEVTRGASSVRRLFLVIAVTMAAMFAIAAANAESASAYTRYVCADSLTLRSSPGGSVIATMYRNYTMDVSSTSGSWSYGYAQYFLGGGIGYTNGWALSAYLSSTRC